MLSLSETALSERCPRNIYPLEVATRVALSPPIVIGCVEPCSERVIITETDFGPETKRTRYFFSSFLFFL